MSKTQPEIRNTRVEILAEDLAGLFTEVWFDNVLIYQALIAQGPIRDIINLFEGKITLSQFRSEHPC